MIPHPLEWIWLDAREVLSIDELAQASALSASDLRELMAYGALTPLDATRQEHQFSAECVAPLRAAGKLRQDYDLDLFTMAILVDCLARINVLEWQVSALKAAMLDLHPTF